MANFDILPPRNKLHTAYWQKINIRNRSELVEAMKAFQPTHVLHCAARTDLDEKIKLDGYSANIDGVCHLIEAIRAVRTVERTVFFSSQLVCKLGYMPQDEYDYCPSTLYGRSKVLGEKILRAAGEFGTVWTIVRPTSLWGPWFDVSYKNFFITIARGLYVHPGNIKTLKQWGFVLNSVYQIHQLLQAPEAKVHRRTFYLADFSPILLCDFANSLQKELGTRPIPTVPYPLLQLVARAGDILKIMGWAEPPLTSFRLGNIVMNEVQDTSPLEQLTGPLPHNEQQGIQVTIRWMRENNLL